MAQRSERDHGSLKRFEVSIEERLLDAFDKLISRRGYHNRSEAIRDLIRDRLVEEEWASGNREVMGTITLVYDHHTRELQSRMTELQHQHHAHVISTLHVHMDHHNCLEVLVVRGRPREIRALSDGLISLKGVKHGRLNATTAGRSLT